MVGRSVLIRNLHLQQGGAQRLAVTSSARVRVTPPPILPVQDEVERADGRDLVADDLALEQIPEVCPDPIYRHVANEYRIVPFVECDQRDVEDGALVARSRVAIARSFMSEHLAAARTRRARAAERGGHREYFARGGRRAAAAGRPSCKTTRLLTRFVWHPRSSASAPRLEAEPRRDWCVPRFARHGGHRHRSGRFGFVRGNPHPLQPFGDDGSGETGAADRTGAGYEI